MLFPRLKQIEQAIAKNESVADIGTDHAFLLAALALEPDRDKVPLIGVELNLGPYLAAKNNIKSLGLDENIDLRLGNGLEPLEVGEVDSIVLSGLGVSSTVEILQKNLEKTRSFKRLYLQPHRDLYGLRSWLVENKFSFLDEHIVYDRGKYYILVVACPQEEKETYSELELKIGPLLLKRGNPLFKEYITNRVDELTQLTDLIKKKNKKGTIPKKLDRELKEYREVLKCL